MTISSRAQHAKGTSSAPTSISRIFRRQLAIATGITVGGHLFLQHGFGISPCVGPSMMPTLALSGDVLITDRRASTRKKLQVGDMVEYKIPISSDHWGCKRIIGMPGDFVERDTPIAGMVESTMIQIPEGHCFLAGDNLPASRDSRLFGPVPLALVRAKVIGVLSFRRLLQWTKSPLKKVERDD